jgi:hypothetical protein
MTRHTILFAQLGPFSYTNYALLEQLQAPFPDYRMEGVRVFDILKKKYWVVLSNIASELMCFGLAIILTKQRAHEHFLMTPYPFSLDESVLSGAISGEERHCCSHSNAGAISCSIAKHSSHLLLGQHSAQLGLCWRHENETRPRLL